VLNDVVEKILRIRSGHRGVNYDIVALLPVNGSRHLVLIGELERVDDTNNLIKIATRSSRVGNSETDDLLGVNHEHCTDGERQALLVNIGCILIIKHIIKRRDLPISVGDNRELEVSFSPLVDIDNPSFMRPDIIRRKAKDLDAPLLKIGSTERDLCELSGTDRGKVVRVGEQNGLTVTASG
jgi:hypothetical protein